MVLRYSAMTTRSIVLHSVTAITGTQGLPFAIRMALQFEIY